MERQKITYKGEDINLNLFVTKTNSKLDENNRMDEFINNELNISINQSDNKEMLVYNGNTNSSNKNISVFFLKENNINSFDFSNNYSDIGFTTEEVTNSGNKFTSSFFILEYFDNNTPTNNNKIFTNFLKPSSIYAKSSNTGLLVFDIANKNLTNHLKVCSLGELSKLYLRISFFNAKKGKRSEFYFNPTTITTSSILNETNRFNEIILNQTDYSWSFKQKMNIYEIDKKPLNKQENNTPNISSTNDIDSNKKGIITNNGIII